MKTGNMDLCGLRPLDGSAYQAQIKGMGFKAVSPLWKVVLPRTDESSLTSLLGFYIESFPPSGIVITGKKNKNIKLEQLNKNQ